MDTLAAISLATEPPSTNKDKWDLFEQRSLMDRIIIPVMWRNILVQVGYQLLVMIVMLYSVPYWFGIGYNYVGTDLYNPIDIDSHYMVQHYTILFHTFVLMNLFNQIACRKIGWSEYNIVSELFNNLWFFIIVGAEFTAQWFIVEVFNLNFRTASLSWPMHITCYSFGIGAILVNLAAKKLFEDKDKYEDMFKFDFNETNEERPNAILNMSNRLSMKVEKSETQRLLDSI
jgi:magnesium-transporting ATPase (P-type)